MKDEISDNLCDMLDAEYVPEESETALVPVQDTELITAPVTIDAQSKKAEAEQDFQDSRELMQRTMLSMENALDSIDKLAGQMETANFWDAYAKVIGQSSQLAKDLMELHQKKDSLSAFVDVPDDTGGDINIENAVVYTGTMADMQRQLKRQKTEDDSDVTESEPE